MRRKAKIAFFIGIMLVLSNSVYSFDFADNEPRNRSLALHLFRGEELTDEDHELLGYILAAFFASSAEPALILTNRLKSRDTWAISACKVDTFAGKYTGLMDVRNDKTQH